MADELILVVDDDEMVCHRAEAALRKSHYRTMKAFDGKQALAIIRDTPPDLMLSDIRMPDIDGLQLFAAGRKLRPDLLAVLMTGHGTIDIAIKALQLGVSGFLQKPFTSSELDFAVEDALLKSRIMRESVRLRLLSPLLEARRYLISELNLTSFCQALVETTASEANADYCAVFLPDEATTDLSVIPDSPVLQPEAVFMASTEKAKVFSPRTFPAGRMAGRALEMGRTLSLRRTDTDALKNDANNNIPGLVLAVPMVSGKRRLGVLLVGRAQVDKSFSMGERELFEVLAGQLASILDNRRLYQILSEREERLHKFINRFVEVQEKDRKLMAGRLNEELIVLLNGARQNLQGYLQKVRPVAGGDDLLQAEKRLQAATVAARRFMHDLHPATLDDYGLSAALRQYVNDFSSATVSVARSFTFKLEGPEIPRLGERIEIAFFRACQEAITNASVRAPGCSIEVLVRVNSQRNKATHVKLQVHDDGPGFDLETLAENESTEQLGLLAIQERVALVGGVCCFSSAPGRGTTVTIDYDIPD